MTDFLKSNINDYKRMALRYLPESIKYLFILESPPFPTDNILLFFYYLETPSQKDTLFKLFIRSIYGIKYCKGDDKNKLLMQFKNDGYFLLDAVGYPINKDINGIDVKNEDIRCDEINLNKNNLINFLNELRDIGNYNKNTKVILIKKSVFNTLFTFLKENNFHIANQEKINYPNQYDYKFINDIHKLIYGVDFEV